MVVISPKFLNQIVWPHIILPRKIVLKLLMKFFLDTFRQWILSYTFSSSSHSLEDWNKNQRSLEGGGETVVVNGENGGMSSPEEEEEGSKEETDERRSTASLPVSKEMGEVLDKEVEQSIQVNNCF